MGSLPQSILHPTANNNYSFACAFAAKRPSLIRRRRRRPVIACKSSDEHELTFDRRDVLVGICGAAAAAAGLGIEYNPASLSGPIEAPDLSKCGHAHRLLPSLLQGHQRLQAPAAVVAPPRPPRSHLVDANYLAKYTKAIELMKALPADDPRNFTL